MPLTSAKTYTNHWYRYSKHIMTSELGYVSHSHGIWHIKLEAFTEKQNQMSGTEAQARENILGMLPVEIQVSEQNENSTKIVSLNDLNLKGMQNVIIVAGDEKFVKDTVISARLEGNDMFTSKETMVIPFIVGVVENQLDSKESKGFGNKQESLMSSPYIAKPQQVSTFKMPFNNVVRSIF